MVKVCEAQFPKGSLPGQKSDGYWMDPLLKANLDIMANKIARDMQFVGLVSGKGTVRNGKSTVAQQQATYLTHKINELHGVHNTFTNDNIVFKAHELIEKAYSLPKYSVIILDEGDDLTAQYYSKLAIHLRRFFRKCGQLNLFLILLIPDFFELPRSYAVTRSTYLINVKFAGEFERGFFEFYSLKKKRELYYKGRRYGDYDCVNPDFEGRFPGYYTVDEEIYRKKKLDDMIHDTADEDTPITRKQINIKKFEAILKLKEDLGLTLTQQQMADAIGVGRTTIIEYYKDIEENAKEKALMSMSKVVI